MLNYKYLIYKKNLFCFCLFLFFCLFFGACNAYISPAYYSSSSKTFFFNSLKKIRKSSFRSKNLFPDSSLYSTFHYSSPNFLPSLRGENINWFSSCLYSTNENEEEKVEKYLIKMPSLSTSDSTSSCVRTSRIIRWYKKVGDEIKIGDLILSAQSDKADVDVEALNEGYLSSIQVAEGEGAKVGDTLGIITSDKKNLRCKDKENNVEEEKIKRMKENLIDIYMPMLSSTMVEGKITQWIKRVGDYVKIGNSILVVESDKADMEVEAFEEGILCDILVQEGQTAKVGNVIAKLISKKEYYDVYMQHKNANSCSNDIENMQMQNEKTAEQQNYEKENSLEKNSKETSFTDLNSSNSSGQLQNNFVEDFLSVVRSTDEGTAYLQLLENTPNGKQELEMMIERAKIRQPIKNIYLGNKEEKKTSYSENFSRSSSSSSVFSILPSAKKEAEKNNVDTKQIKGTGKHGRITQNDVLNYLSSTSQPSQSYPSSSDSSSLVKSKTSLSDVYVHNTSSDAVHTQQSHSSEKSADLFSIIPFTPMQKAIAKNMQLTTNTPVFEVSYRICTDAWDSLHSKLREFGISSSVLLSKAVAITLKKHFLLNSSYDQANEGSIKRFNDINIAIAVSVEGGLVTPVLKNSDRKTVYELANEWKELVTKARNKKLSASDNAGGTFYISNLGMYGVHQFNAVLPYGSSAILAVGKSDYEVLPMQERRTDKQEKEKRASEVTETKNLLNIGIKKIMTVTLTCDHRVVNGADAALFLKDLANLIENEPTRIML